MLFDFRKSSCPTFSQPSRLFLFVICGQIGSCPLGLKAHGKSTSSKYAAGEKISLGFCFILLLEASSVSRQPTGLLGLEKSQRAHGRVFVAPNPNSRASEALVIVEGDGPQMLSGASQVLHLPLSLNLEPPSLQLGGACGHTHIDVVIKQAHSHSPHRP